LKQVIIFVILTLANLRRGSVASNKVAMLPVILTALFRNISKKGKPKLSFFYLLYVI